MISLGGVELNGHLMVPDFATMPRVAGSERRTLGNRLIVQRLPMGIRLSLMAKYENGRLYGYFTHSQVVAIRAMAESGQPVAFVYHGETVLAVVPRDGLKVAMLQNRTDPLPDTKYYGSIDLEV